MTEEVIEHPYPEEDLPKDSIAAAMVRLRDRLATVHPQAAAIVTGCAALEVEVNYVLQQFVVRPFMLPRMSLEHSLSMLRALVADPWLDQMLDVISAYAGLRNAVAHGDPPEAIEKAISRLIALGRSAQIEPDDEPNFGSYAMVLATGLHMGVEDQPGLRPT